MKKVIVCVVLLLLAAATMFRIQRIDSNTLERPKGIQRPSSATPPDAQVQAIPYPFNACYGFDSISIESLTFSSTPTVWLDFFFVVVIFSLT